MAAQMIAMYVGALNKNNKVIGARTQRNATQRNALQCNAAQRNETHACTHTRNQAIDAIVNLPTASQMVAQLAGGRAKHAGLLAYERVLSACQLPCPAALLSSTHAEAAAAAAAAFDEEAMTDDAEQTAPFRAELDAVCASWRGAWLADAAGRCLSLSELTGGKLHDAWQRNSAAVQDLFDRLVGGAIGEAEHDTALESARNAFSQALGDGGSALFDELARRSPMLARAKDAAQRDALAAVESRADDRLDTD